MRKVALITGITGQDGSYLAEFLVEKGYEVHGIMRRSSSFNTARIEHLYLDEWVRDMKKSRLVNLHWGDMTDSSSLIRIISDIHPTEIYNLAAQSHVKVSFDVPEYTAEADAVARSASWRPCVSAGWRRLAAFIRLPRPNCSARCRKCRNGRPRLSIRVRPTAWPSNTVSG